MKASTLKGEQEKQQRWLKEHPQDAEEPPGARADLDDDGPAHPEGMLGGYRPIASPHSQWTLAGYNELGFACLGEQMPGLLGTGAHPQRGGHRRGPDMRLVGRCLTGWPTNQCARASWTS